MAFNKPVSISTRMNNTIRQVKPTLAKDRAKDSNVCDIDHINESSNSKQCVLTSPSSQVHSRQTLLSEYFSKQETHNLTSVESKSNGNVMIDFRKLVSQLLNAKVMVERLPRAAAKAKLCPSLQICLERLQSEQQKPKTALLQDNQSTDKIDYVRRYCHKCKTAIVERKNVSRQKNCQECGTHLIYICTKCNKKPYTSYRTLQRHWKSCKFQKKYRQRNLMGLRCCVDCEFVTAYESPMRQHQLKTNHSFCGGEEVESL